MPHRPRPLPFDRLLAVVALLLSSAATAQTAVSTAASAPIPTSSASPPLVDTQDKIKAERQAVKDRFAAQERECKKRFIVTSCVDVAKRQRRDELDRLRTRQIAVDEAKRRERSQSRRNELAAKAAEDAKRETDRGDRPPAEDKTSRGRLVPPGRPSAAAAAASAPASGVKPRTKPVGGIKQKVPDTPQVRQATEAEKRSAYDARQKKAAEHRDTAQTQAVKRMADKPPAAALPVPSASSSVFRSASGAASAASR